MREPVKDKGRLEHIIDAISNIEQFTDGYDYDTLLSDKLHLHATVHNIQIVGEAVYKLSIEFKESHPETPWLMIEKLRHVLVHDYYQINFEILWEIIKKDIPALKEQIKLYQSR